MKGPNPAGRHQQVRGAPCLTCHTAPVNALLGDLWQYPFRADVWGTAGQWFSGIVSGGALGLGFYLMLRDRRKEERAQAQLITCRREPTGPRSDSDGDPVYPGLVHVLNHSTRPIYSITARPLLVSWPEYQRRIANVPGIGKPSYSEQEWRNPEGKLRTFAESVLQSKVERRVLNPDETLSLEYAAPMTARYYDILVEFTDAEGIVWSRNVDTSNLRRSGPTRIIHYNDGLVPKRRSVIDKVRETVDRRSR